MRRTVHRAPHMCVCALVCVWLGDLRWTLTRRLLVVVYCLAVYSLGCFFYLIFFFFSTWHLESPSTGLSPPAPSLPPSLSPFSFPAFASPPVSLSIYCFFVFFLSISVWICFVLDHTRLSLTSVTLEQAFFFFFFQLPLFRSSHFLLHTHAHTHLPQRPVIGDRRIVCYSFY